LREPLFEAIACVIKRFANSFYLFSKIACKICAYLYKIWSASGEIGKDMDQRENMAPQGTLKTLLAAKREIRGPIATVGASVFFLGVFTQAATLGWDPGTKTYSL
jgi:hypothetical protein